MAKVGRPPGMNFPQNVTVRFTDEQVKAIEVAADRAQVKRGTLIRDIIDAWLKGQE